MAAKNSGLPNTFFSDSIIKKVFELAFNTGLLDWTVEKCSMSTTVIGNNLRSFVIDHFEENNKLLEKLSINENGHQNV